MVSQKNNLWGWCFITSTSLAPHVFLLGCIKLNPNHWDTWLWLSISDFLDLFLYLEPSILSTVAFPPFRNSNDVAASVSIDFPSNSKGDTSAEDYSCASWGSPCDHLGGVLRKDMLKLGCWVLWVGPV